MTSSDKNYVTVEDLIQIAIQFEIDSAELYKRMQATAEEDNVLEILKLLEKQEREHELKMNSLRSRAEMVEPLKTWIYHVKYADPPKSHRAILIQPFLYLQARW